MEEFLKELTELCHKHGLFIETADGGFVFDANDHDRGYIYLDREDNEYKDYWND